MPLTDLVTIVGPASEAVPVVEEFRRRGIRANYSFNSRGQELIAPVVVLLEASWPLHNPERYALVVRADASSTSVLRAVSMGASAVVDRTIHPVDLVDLVLRLRPGWVEMSSPIARALNDHAPERLVTLTSEEADWLTALAAGEGAAEISHAIGLSERELYRRLRLLYRRMNVRGREGAIAVAARAGYIDWNGSYPLRTPALSAWMEALPSM
jgi:DNA-binding CsgD family transcriptional regulator